MDEYFLNRLESRYVGAARTNAPERPDRRQDNIVVTDRYGTVLEAEKTFPIGDNIFNYVQLKDIHRFRSAMMTAKPTTPTAISVTATYPKITKRLLIHIFISSKNPEKMWISRLPHAYHDPSTVWIFAGWVLEENEKQRKNTISPGQRADLRVVC